MNIFRSINLFFLFYVFNLIAEPIPTPRHVFSSIEGVVVNHPGEYPFPTDLTFRRYSTHSIDKMTEYFDPDWVSKGDTIYLSDWYIPWFTKYIHPKIRHPYILVSSDSDSWHPHEGREDYTEKEGWPPPLEATRTLLYDSKVAAWFCKNMVLSRHPKITQIPIGPSIIYWHHHFPPVLSDLLELAKNPDREKEHFLYISFYLSNNPVRAQLMDLFKDKPYVYTKLLPREEYLQTLSKSKFTLAPPGIGPDTVRFWEAIYVGCIPVLKHFELDDLYADLPALFVHNWEDITEDFLKEKYAEIHSKTYNKEKAYFDYWHAKMLEAQNKVRCDQNHFSKLESTLLDNNTLDDLLSILGKHRLTPHDRLICKGAAMALRPFQIAEKTSYSIYTQDRWGAWGHEPSTAHLEKFTSHPLLKLKNRCISISFWDDVYHLSSLNLSHKARMNIFLDLSYLRTNLQEDLLHFWSKSTRKILLCGNLYSDPYVAEVLSIFSKKVKVKVENKGDIWFIKN